MRQAARSLITGTEASVEADSVRHRLRARVITALLGGRF